MKKILFLSLLSTSAIITSAHAKEAETKQPNKLQAIIVKGKKEALTVSDTAIARENIKKIPGSAIVVDSESYKNGKAVTVKDALDYVPGVLAQSRSGEESRLSIRGSGLSRTYHLRGLSLYQDGIPINMADGAADFQDIDPLALDHIEVYKGANALQFGSATLGGGINFVTPTGYNSSPFSAVVEGGSNGTAIGHAASGKVIGNFDYYTSLTEYHSDGYREQNGQTDSKFFSNFGYRINDNIENRTYFTYVNTNLELPGALTRSQLRTNPQMANPGNVALHQERNFNEYRVANKTTWSFDDVIVNAGVYTNIKDLNHPIFQVIDQNSTNLGVFADSTFRGNIAGLTNELLFGTNLSNGDTDSKRFVNSGGSPAALTVDGEEKAKTAIFYTQDSLSITDKLRLIAGSQFMYTERDYADRFLSNGNQSGERSYYGTSPKIGAIYDYTKNVQFYTNLSAAFEPPTFTEAEQTTASGLANISAQKSYTLEIGTRGSADKVNWDVAVYRSHIRDELMLYTISPGVAQAVNADKTVHQGIEIGFDMKILQDIFGDKLGDSVTWKTAYTFSDFHFDDDATYGNNDIPGAPEHYIRTELRYDNPAGFYLSPNLELSPKGFAIDSAHTKDTSGYYLIGLGAGYDIDKHATLFVDARNLFDRNYAATADVFSTSAADPAAFYPGDGRTIYAGLKYKW